MNDAELMVYGLAVILGLAVIPGIRHAKMTRRTKIKWFSVVMILGAVAFTLGSVMLGPSLGIAIGASTIGILSFGTYHLTKDWSN